MTVVIAISGPDGSGKTFMSKRIKAILDIKGFKAITIPEYSYMTPLASLISKINKATNVSTLVTKNEMNRMTVYGYGAKTTIKSLLFSLTMLIWALIKALDVLLFTSKILKNLKDQKTIIIFDRHILDYMLDFEILANALFPIIKKIYLLMYTFVKPNVQIILLASKDTLYKRILCKRLNTHQEILYYFCIVKLLQYVKISNMLLKHKKRYSEQEPHIAIIFTDANNTKEGCS